MSLMEAARSTDADFLARFEAGALPRAEWTHAAHVRVAFLCLRAEGDFERAVRRIRRGIWHHNEARGIANTSTSGYHETLTQAWGRLVAAALAHDAGASADAAAFLSAHPWLLRQETLLEHYSRPRLMSPEARAGWLPPDLLPLPEPS